MMALRGEKYSLLPKDYSPASSADSTGSFTLKKLNGNADDGPRDRDCAFHGSRRVAQISPAAALRAAQISMQKDPRWTSPHYWAAFTLHDQWK